MHIEQMSQINVYFPCAARALMGNGRETGGRRFGGTPVLQGEENPQLLIHTERHSHDLKKTRPELLSSPSNASARHTSKDVGHPQPFLGLD